MESEVKPALAVYREVRDQLTARFDHEHPDEADRAHARLSAGRLGRLLVRRPQQRMILDGLVLYGRLVTARLLASGREDPDWRLILQLSLWIERLEAGLVQQEEA